jgi:hypothetical protein
MPNFAAGALSAGQSAAIGDRTLNMLTDDEQRLAVFTARPFSPRIWVTVPDLFGLSISFRISWSG